VKRTFDVKFWLGIGISVFFMAMLFRKIDFHQLGAALRIVDYRYIALAVAFTFMSYFLRAVRWRYLLISEKDIPLSSLYPATIIGYMANNILPARLGEFVRAYVLARREGLDTPAVFASLVIDRLFDGSTVLLILLATLFTLQLPGNMADAGTALRVVLDELDDHTLATFRSITISTMLKLMARKSRESTMRAPKVSGRVASRRWRGHTPERKSALFRAKGGH